MIIIIVIVNIVISNLPEVNDGWMVGRVFFLVMCVLLPILYINVLNSAHEHLRM